MNYCWKNFNVRRENFVDLHSMLHSSDKDKLLNAISTPYCLVWFAKLCYQLYFVHSKRDRVVKVIILIFCNGIMFHQEIASMDADTTTVTDDRKTSRQAEEVVSSTTEDEAVYQQGGDYSANEGNDGASKIS